MPDKILIVDDDENILNSFRRTLRKDYNIETALGSEMGLKKVQEDEPYAVIVSDYNMPVMNGIKFFGKIREILPDTVRIMLTGNADLQIAISAVNEGQIFRFLTKPCPQETLTKALDAGLRQYQLIQSEKELLEKTLHGSIKVLSDILSIINPLAFGLASRIRRHVMYLAEKLQLPQLWQIEIAAMLSQIGFIVIPPHLLEKIQHRQELNEQEVKIVAEYPMIGSQLLGSIPRMETIARIIALHQKPFSMFDPPERLSAEQRYIALAAQLIKVVTGYSDMTSRGIQRNVAISALIHKPLEYNEHIVELLRSLPEEDQEIFQLVHVDELTTNMVTLDDIVTQAGLVLVTKGQELTAPLIERLKNYGEETKIIQPIKVQYISVL